MPFPRATAALLVLTGCVAVEPPGELVGAYAVTGTLLENTCGEGLPAVDPMTFEVELREDEGLGYWLVAPPARLGHLSASGEFSFEVERSYTVTGGRPPEITIETDPELALDPERVEREQMPTDCTLVVSELVEGAVARDPAASDTDPSEPALVGRNEIAVRATAASRCAALLVAAGGPWEALPCHVLYDLEGESTTPAAR